MHGRTAFLAWASLLLFLLASAADAADCDCAPEGGVCVGDSGLCGCAAGYFCSNGCDGNERPEFKQMRFGTASCEVGYAPITTFEDCKRATETVWPGGWSSATKDPIMPSFSMPKGCYRLANACQGGGGCKLKFNANSKNVARGNAAPVCKRFSGNACTKITEKPTKQPTKLPTSQPTFSPTAPTPAPSPAPSRAPTGHPTTPAPSASPTGAPTTSAPSSSPTKAPTPAPSAAPSQAPSKQPTTGRPTAKPSAAPSAAPSSKAKALTGAPTEAPTEAPVQSQSRAPSLRPSAAPTNSGNGGNDGGNDNDGDGVDGAGAEAIVLRVSLAISGLPRRLPGSEEAAPSADAGALELAAYFNVGEILRLALSADVVSIRGAELRPVARMGGARRLRRLDDDDAADTEGKLVVSYEARFEDPSAARAAMAILKSPTLLPEYFKSAQASTHGERFPGLAVSVVDEPEMITEGEADGGGGDNMRLVIIAGAAAGGLLLVTIFLVFLVRYKRGRGSPLPGKKHKTMLFLRNLRPTKASSDRRQLEMKMDATLPEPGTGAARYTY